MLLHDPLRDKGNGKPLIRGLLSGSRLESGGFKTQFSNILPPIIILMVIMTTYSFNFAVGMFQLFWTFYFLMFFLNLWVPDEKSDNLL